MDTNSLDQVLHQNVGDLRSGRWAFIRISESLKDDACPVCLEKCWPTEEVDDGNDSDVVLVCEEQVPTSIIVQLKCTHEMHEECFKRSVGKAEEEGDLMKCAICRDVVVEKPLLLKRYKQGDKYVENCWVPMYLVQKKAPSTIGGLFTNKVQVGYGRNAITLYLCCEEDVTNDESQLLHLRCNGCNLSCSPLSEEERYIDGLYTPELGVAAKIFAMEKMLNETAWERYVEENNARGENAGGEENESRAEGRSNTVSGGIENNPTTVVSPDFSARTSSRPIKPLMTREEVFQAIVESLKGTDNVLPETKNHLSERRGSEDCNTIQHGEHEALGTTLEQRTATERESSRERKRLRESEDIDEDRIEERVPEERSVRARRERRVSFLNDHVKDYIEERFSQVTDEITREVVRKVRMKAPECVVNSVKETIRKETRRLLPDEVIRVVTGECMKELNDNLAEVRREIRDEVRAEVRVEVRAEVQTQIRSAFRAREIRGLGWENLMDGGGSSRTGRQESRRDSRTP